MAVTSEGVTTNSISSEKGRSTLMMTVAAPADSTTDGLGIRSCTVIASVKMMYIYIYTL